MANKYYKCNGCEAECFKIGFDDLPDHCVHKYGTAQNWKQVAPFEVVEKLIIESKPGIKIILTEAVPNCAVCKWSTARGQADSILLVAQAQAEANKLITRSLTPQVLEFRKLEKWNGVLPQVTGVGSALINLK